MILSKILKILLTRDLKMISRAKKFCAREKIVRGDSYDFFSRAPIRNFGGVFVHVCVGQSEEKGRPTKTQLKIP